jgi:iron complex outermembrane receptor protein
MRAEWMGGTLRTNLTGFYYDYKNLQVSQVQGASVLIQNAAKAEVYGLEAEITAIPAEHLMLEANISLLHSEYKDFVSADPARAGLGPIDLAGNQLTQAPEYTFNLNATYTIPTSSGDVILRGEGRWVDTVYLTQYNLPHTSQPAYELFNAFLTWNKGDGLSATAFIRNIANKDVISAGLISSSLVGSPFVGSWEPPRTYGLSVSYRF